MLSALPAHLRGLAPLALPLLFATGGALVGGSPGLALGLGASERSRCSPPCLGSWSAFPNIVAFPTRQDGVRANASRPHGPPCTRARPRQRERSEPARMRRQGSAASAPAAQGGLRAGVGGSDVIKPLAHPPSRPLSPKKLTLRKRCLSPFCEEGLGFRGSGDGGGAEVCEVGFDGEAVVVE